MVAFGLAGTASPPQASAAAERSTPRLEER